MAVITTTSGHSVVQDDNESILNAASRQGLNLPYSCRTGRCSTCKCKVLLGETRLLHDELGLTPEEKSQGWVLSCVRTAVGDVRMEADDLEGVTIPSAKTLPCRIDSLEKLADDVLKVMLRLPPSNGFTYLPGQYVDVIGPGGMRRSYSLAGGTVDAQRLELHIRAVPGGAMSEYWFGQAKVNDLLRLNGPLGTFFLRRTAERDLVFLATGTGFAPVKSMLEGLATMAEQDQPRSVTILWGGRVPADLYWSLDSIAETHRYMPVLSRASQEWTGRRGYVHHALLAENLELDNAVVYACGSDAMIHSAKEALVAAGLPERQFLSDAFVCSASV